MTDLDLQTRVIEALSPRPTQLGLDVIAYRRFDDAPVTVYTRFLGEQAASAVVQNPHDERTVLDFLLETEQPDLAAVSADRPIVARPSRAAERLGFDVRVVVHPSARQLPALLVAAPFLESVTYLTFPAFSDEVAEASTASQARMGLERIQYAQWDRRRGAH